MSCSLSLEADFHGDKALLLLGVFPKGLFSKKTERQRRECQNVIPSPLLMPSRPGCFLQPKTTTILTWCCPHDSLLQDLITCSPPRYVHSATCPRELPVICYFFLNPAYTFVNIILLNCSQIMQFRCGN